MRLSPEDRRIRRLRPDAGASRPASDRREPIGWLVEPERQDRVLTVFLAGAECPFTCAFCDLWRHTSPAPTAPGALPAQLGRAFEAAGPGPFDRVKLYNASNFFDPRSVPPDDHEALAMLLAPISSVVVESHARTVGPRCLEFAARLPGRLEVAMGLETVHPEALPRLNKRMTLDQFARAAGFLAEHGLDLRAFVLVGTPYVPPAESVHWTVRSVAWALDRGARHVTIIPARGGNGEMERLAQAGEFTPPTLRQLEQALTESLSLVAPPRPSAVTADLWDVTGLPACEGCRGARIERLRRMNAAGLPVPPVACSVCGEA